MSVIVERRKTFEQAAAKLAKINEHDLHGFSPDSETVTKSKAYCRKCGAAVYVSVSLDADEAAITGDPVTRKCGKN